MSDGISPPTPGSPDLPDGRQPPRTSHDSRAKRRRRRTALAAALLLTGLVSVAIRLMELPISRAIELRYCQKYYLIHDPTQIDDNGNISERLCKVDPVQRDLGWLSGALATVTVLCDIAVTGPMGIVADRLGPRLALLLNVLAFAVYISWTAAVAHFWTIFPINALLAAPFLSIWGGGACVARMAALAMITEIANSDHRLPLYFAYASSVEYATSLISPPLSAFLLEKNLWLPFWVGLVCLAAGAPLVALLPPGTQGKHKLPQQQYDNRSQRQPESEPLLASSASASTADKIVKPPNVLRELFVGYNELLRASHAFHLILVVFFLKGAAGASNIFLLQYISKRYGWTFAQVGYLFTLKAAANVLCLTVLVPAWSHLASARLKMTTFSINFVGGQAALIVLAIGACLVAVSPSIWMLIPSLVIYASGTVAPAFLYAVAKSSEVGLITEENQGKAFAVIVLVTSIGELACLPLNVAVWMKAIEMAGGWFGLPFYISTALWALAAAVLWRMKSRVAA